MIRFTLLHHFRDNVLDAVNEREYEDWKDFCKWIISEGHELRGTKAGEDESLLKNGLRGANRFTVMLPADPKWDDPDFSDDKDYEFIDRRSDNVIRRCNANIEGAQAFVVLDLDDLTVEEHEELTDRLEDYDALQYSSWSHGKTEGIVKVRVIVRLDADHPAEVMARVRRGAAAVLGVRNDGQTCAPSNLFFLPSTHPSRSDKAFFIQHGGDALTVEECLDAAPETAKEVRRRMQRELGLSDYDGRPATDEDRTQALARLDRWCLSLSYKMPGESLRVLTEQGTYNIGRFVGARALDMESTRQRMHEALKELVERIGDDQSIDHRLGQIDTGLTQGAARPLLPASKEQEAEIADGETEADVTFQLRAHRPTGTVTLDEARKASFSFGLGTERGSLRVDASSAGTGKSYNIAKVASSFARRGLVCVVQTQENSVGAQTRAVLDPDVSSVQLYSPLSPPNTAPASHKCPRYDELAETCREFTIPLRKMCARCPLADTCEALAAHKERSQAMHDAQVVFVSQAGIGQVADLLRDGAVLFTDEQPTPVQSSRLSREFLELVAGEGFVPFAPPDIAEMLAAVARQALGGPPARDAMPEDEWYVSVDTLVQLEPEERHIVRKAQVLWDCHLGVRQGSIVPDGLEVWTDTASHTAMVTYGGLLCDATPFYPALPRDAVLLKQNVEDSAPIRRIMRVCKGLGSGGILPDGEVNGDKVMFSVRRALAYKAKRTLFITFTAAHRWLEENRAAYDLPDEHALAFAHFGATRGKNTWKDYDCVYIFGSPRFDKKQLIKRYVEGEEAVKAEWRAAAAREQEQALARVRNVSRKEPCIMVCESDIVPTSWFDESPGLEIEHVREETCGVFAELKAAKWTDAKIASELGLSESAVAKWKKRGVSNKHLPMLTKMLTSTR